MSKLTDIRPSVLAGSWYQANPDELAESVDNYINKAEIPPIPGNIIVFATKALIVL